MDKEQIRALYFQVVGKESPSRSSKYRLGKIAKVMSAELEVPVEVKMLKRLTKFQYQQLHTIYASGDETFQPKAKRILGLAGDTDTSVALRVR